MNIYFLCSNTPIDAKDCHNLTSVKWLSPIDGISWVDEGMFSSCTSLVSCILPDTCFWIRSYSFMGCSSLVSIDIPDSVSQIESSAFAGCTSMAYIVLPESVASRPGYVPRYGVDRSAFPNCLGLGLELGNDDANSNRLNRRGGIVGYVRCLPCFNVSSLDIPDTVTTIGELSFQDCPRLTRVVIPDSVTNLNGFRSCTSLASIVIPDSVTTLSGFASCTSLTSIVIPDSVMAIGPSAFVSCTSVSSISISNSVLSIGEGAFYGMACSQPLYQAGYTICNCIRSRVYRGHTTCAPTTSPTTSHISTMAPVTTSLSPAPTSVLPTPLTLAPTSPSPTTQFPSPLWTDSPTTEPTSAPTSEPTRSNCMVQPGPTGLVALWDWITDIPSSAFADCIELTDIIISSSVVSIGDAAFSGTGLTSLILPRSVAIISNSSFEKCSSLGYIVIPDSVYTGGIAASTFPRCYGYGFGTSGVSYPRGVHVEICVPCSGSAPIVIPSSVTSLSPNSFAHCATSSVVIPDSVTIVPQYFCAGSQVSAIVIPGSITSIADHAFSGCASLTSISIPDAVTRIAAYTFENCASLTSVVIPDSITSIAGYAFVNCWSLMSLVIPGTVANIDTYAFSQVGITLVVIPDSVTTIATLFCSGSRITTIVIPDSITSIGFRSFAECASLTSITISDTVTSIAQDAFTGSPTLTSMLIPDSVTWFEGSAFESAALTSLVIPDSITSIPDYAFVSCSNLASVTIPNSVTSIGANAFKGCSSLSSIVMPTLVTINSSAFNDTAWSWYGYYLPCIPELYAAGARLCDCTPCPPLTPSAAPSSTPSAHVLSSPTALPTVMSSSLPSAVPTLAPVYGTSRPIAAPSPSAPATSSTREPVTLSTPATSPNVTVLPSESAHVSTVFIRPAVFALIIVVGGAVIATGVVFGYRRWLLRSRHDIMRRPHRVDAGQSVKSTVMNPTFEVPGEETV